MYSSVMVLEVFQRRQSLEDEECGGRLTEIDNNQLRGSSMLILLELYEKLPKNSSVDYSLVIWHLKQIGKVKNLVIGCLVSKSKK